jgi:hypothetical protein
VTTPGEAAPQGQRFDPEIGDRIRLFGEPHEYEFLPLPNVPHVLHAAEAGRSIVYKVRRAPDGALFALKVFLRQFRTPELAAAQGRLAPVAKLRGMRAAERRTVTPEDPAARRWPALAYAMLMPWIAGTTWYDVLVDASAGRTLERGTARALGREFLALMAQLEERRFAHADLAPGNVVIEVRASPTTRPAVELIDLEDMYMPGAPVPSTGYCGTPGYRHPVGDTGQSIWGPAGDRYAAAVLTAEMLLLGEPTFAARATDTGYFGGHRFDPAAQRRYEAAAAWLGREVPRFGQALAEAWRAERLSDCPPLHELLHALESGARAGTRPGIGAPDAPAAARATPPGSFNFAPLDLSQFGMPQPTPGHAPHAPHAPRRDGAAAAGTSPAPPTATPAAVWERPPTPGTSGPSVDPRRTTSRPTPPGSTPGTPDDPSPTTANVIGAIIVLLVILLITYVLAIS